MSSLGIILMAAGMLSAVLPLLGRQFVLMSFLGMTGLGSALTGILLIGIGLALYLVGQKRKRHRLLRGVPARDDKVKRP